MTNVILKTGGTENPFIDKMDVKIEQSWKDALAPEFGKPYFEQLVRFLHQEKEAGKLIYPRGSRIFHAFELTPIERVKVVILGQDPYHGPGQAMGLSFSVPNGIPAPATSLEPWARQGVLLLNSVLTVEAGRPTSHSGIGWQQFTDAVISTLSERRSGLVFLLWGRFAQQKQELIDRQKHHILLAAHPSPLARGAFFGCRHFSQTNDILTREGLSPIDWQL